MAVAVITGMRTGGRPRGAAIAPAHPGGKRLQAVHTRRAMAGVRRKCLGRLLVVGWVLVAGFWRSVRRTPRRGQSFACVRPTSLAARMPASYSRHIGIASISCEITSGGVTIAAMTKMPTMA